MNGHLAQLVRALRSHRRGHWFEPSIAHHKKMTAIISEQIKILAELQKIDSEIYALRQEIEAYPEIQKKADQEFDNKKLNLKSAEDEHRALQAKQKGMEIELGSKEDKIAKLQSQLFSLKSNKEYQAMDFEIKALKADKSLLEEEILIFFDSIETAKAKVTKEKELLSVEEKKHKEELSVTQKRIAEIQADIQVHEEKRKAFTPSIDPKILPQYEKLLKNREGLAIAPIRNNSCGGCNIGLPPQIVNEARMLEKFITCESCARMLYWAP